MHNESFVVGCDSAAFHNGVVILDLAGLSAAERDSEGRPKRELRCRLIMTPQAMLETMGAMQGIAKRLAEIGVLRPGEAGQAGPAAPGSPDKTDDGKKGGNGGDTPNSPNF